MNTPQLELRDRGWHIAGLDIPVCNRLTASLFAFRYHTDHDVREEMFWNVADILWNDGRVRPLCERHRWADATVKGCIREKYLALGGSAGSGKSYTLAAFAIVEWLCAPSETLVLVTSTTIQAAKTRIWGAILTLLDATDGLPLAIRASIGSAAYVTPEGSVLETAGIRLIAAEKSQTRDAVGKLIGMHNQRVIFVADELSELSEAIVQAGMTNMTQNPYFRMRAASNPNSPFDAFGDWSEPAGGWKSVDLMNDMTWRTKYGGLFIRFDAEDSPNFDYDEPRYNYLPTRETIDDAREVLGSNSRGFMRMYRAVFFDSDESEGIYSEPELIHSGAMDRVGLERGIKLAALDPSFTNGGDECVLTFGTVGTDPTGQFALQTDETVVIFDDATNKETPRSYQIARQVIEACRKRGVSPENFALDASSAGGPLADIIASEWSPDILRVQFGGGASDRPVSASRRTPSKHLFFNRVSELWFCGKELIRCKQLRGIPKEVAKQMCARRYDTVKGEHGLRMKAESKVEYKRRLNHSPDRADAFFVLVELARARHGLLAVEPPKEKGDGLDFLRRNPRGNVPTMDELVLHQTLV